MTSFERRRQRLLTLLALAEHIGTPTEEARTALAGADRVIAAADGGLDRYRLRVRVAGLLISMRAFARCFPEPTRP